MLLWRRESPGKHTHARFFLPRSTSDTARTKRVPPMKRFFTTVRAPLNKESSDCGAFAETERKDAKVESLSLSLSRQDRSGLDNAPPFKTKERFGEHNFPSRGEIKRKRDAYLSSSLFTFRPHFLRRRANGRVSFDGLDSSSRGDFRACEGRRQHGDDSFNNTIFVGRSRPNKNTFTQTQKTPNIQFRVLDNLEEKSLWKKRRKTPA